LAKAVEDMAGKTAHAMTGKPGTAEQDILMLSIVFAAIILFVGTGGTIMSQIVNSWLHGGEAPGDALSNAVLLNIALLIFGWRRYRVLQLEVAERRRAEERAYELAATDELTGCLNRRSNSARLRAMLERAQEQGSKVCVFMIDLDNFKQINDMNGHLTGDKVLQALAVRLKAALPSGALLARIGGDEFACAVLHESGQLDRMDAFAQALTETVAAPIVVDRLTLEATVSVGLASTGQALDAEEVTPDAETLLNRADIAMYQAKKTGRNRHCWFAMQYEDERRFRNELESAIRTGIPAGEFVPYYEQQIDLESGRLTGFEMLARWNSPRFGLVSPEVFIPVAEEIELISDLSETLIRQALADARDWHPSLTLSVNISPIQLRDPWFAQRLLRLLAESGFPSGRLEIEITESCLHENIGAVRTMIVSLRNQGIRVSLDDFGTGYASLAQLRSLPFDRLKIDRSFVTEMTRNGGSNELVRAIISLGRGLALPVTAEGIEDLEVLAALQDMGTIKGQGFLYGRPEDAASTRERLAGMSLLADENPLLPEAVRAPADAPLELSDITSAGPARQVS
jgi:diguanylate cyclase (GGDEF)-like protein